MAGVSGVVEREEGVKDVFEETVPGGAPPGAEPAVPVVVFTAAEEVGPGMPVEVAVSEGARGTGSEEEAEEGAG